HKNTSLSPRIHKHTHIYKKNAKRNYILKKHYFEYNFSYSSFFLSFFIFDVRVCMHVFAQVQYLPFYYTFPFFNGRVIEEVKESLDQVVFDIQDNLYLWYAGSGIA